MMDLLAERVVFHAVAVHGHSHPNPLELGLLSPRGLNMNLAESWGQCGGCFFFF